MHEVQELADACRLRVTTGPGTPGIVRYRFSTPSGLSLGMADGHAEAVAWLSALREWLSGFPLAREAEAV